MRDRTTSSDLMSICAIKKNASAQPKWGEIKSTVQNHVVVDPASTNRADPNSADPTFWPKSDSQRGSSKTRVSVFKWVWWVCTVQFGSQNLVPPNSNLKFKDGQKFGAPSHHFPFLPRETSCHHSAGPRDPGAETTVKTGKFPNHQLDTAGYNMIWPKVYPWDVSCIFMLYPAVLWIQLDKVSPWDSMMFHVTPIIVASCCALKLLHTWARCARDSERK